MAINFDAIPEELKARKQWVLWKTITRAGKPTKVPYDTTGREGDSSDPSRWESYADVVAAYQKGGYEGIGFTFDTLDPYAGVDLDHCVNPDGSIKPKAKAILDKLNGYSEISPSGKGIKIFCKAKIPVSIRKKEGKYQQGFNSKKADLEIEIYYGNRFFTLTGNRLDQYSPNVEDRNKELTEIFQEVFKDRHYFAGDSEPAHSTSETESEPLSSDSVERLQDLFEADPTFKDEFYTPAPVGHRSDAEFHLCARLWEAGFDDDEIYQIMGSSSQTKWLERGDDYRWSTIKSAVAKAEANHRARAEEDAKKEAAKKATPIVLKDVADIEYDEDGKITDVRFSPTFAARVVMERIPLKMSEDSEDIYRFNGQIYKPDGARIIDMALCDAATDKFTGNMLRETLRRIKNRLLENPVTFDPDPYLLGVKNGVVDLRTGKFREYRPEDLITDNIDVAYDQNAKCPRFMLFLEEVEPVTIDRLMLIDWFAIHAIREMFAFVLFLLGLGRNGKGIYERLLKKFFKEENFSEMPLEELSVKNNRFAGAALKGKRGQIVSEAGEERKPGSKRTIPTNYLKFSTGDGTIDSDQKGTIRTRFKPFYKATIDSNDMPLIGDASKGWIERFCKANMPFVFVDDPRPGTLERKKDPHLFEKLTTDDELSGILNLILSRTPELIRTRTITKRPGSEMFAEYQKQSSSVNTFLETFCDYKPVSDKSKDIFLDLVFEKYEEWCDRIVADKVDDKRFGKVVKTFCKGTEPERMRDGDKKRKIYHGLSFDINRYQAHWDHYQTIKGPLKTVTAPLGPLNDEKYEVMWENLVKTYGEERDETKNPSFFESMGPLSITKNANGPDSGFNGPQNQFNGPDSGSIKADLHKAEERAKAKEAKFKTPPKKEDAKVSVRFKIDYKTQLPRPGNPNAFDDREFHEGETLEVSSWQAKLWAGRGVVEVLEASA